MSRRLRVGIDASRAWVAQPTGTERYATAVIEALLARDRHDYTLYARTAPRGAPAAATVRVIKMPRAWTHTRLALEIARHPPDVLWVPAHVLPWVVGCPAVVTVHDLGHRVFPGAHTAAQRAYLEWSTRHHVRRAAALIADSTHTRQDLLTLYGADPRRVAVVPLGVDAEFTRASASAVVAARAAAGVPEDARYVVHVGTVQPRKNLERLVRAFARLANERPDLVLVVSGGAGWGGVDLAGLARTLGVGERVLLPGYVAREHLPGLYTGAVACALPSLYEGFGLTALEAMACGCPVVGADTSSIPEVVGDTGVLVSPLDDDALTAALASVADNPVLRARLGGAARGRAASYSWAATAAGVEAVLESVV